MVSARPINMRQSTALSLLLHIGVVAIFVIWSIWQPFSPDELTFDEVEIIDTQTFEALVAQSQAGADGENTADAPVDSQQAVEADVAAPEIAPAPDAPSAQTPPQDEPTIPDAPAPDTVQDVIEETPPPAPPVPAPAIQPDNLPDPIFNPQNIAPAQPLPQVPEADQSGIADADSQGQEQASETTNALAPPARDAAQLRDIAVESSTPSVNEEQAEVVVTQSGEAVNEAEAQVAEEVDATSSVEPEAQADAPLTASPAVALAPPSRPANLTDLPLPNPQIADANETPAEAPAVDTSNDAQTNTDTADATPATNDTPDDTTNDTASADQSADNAASSTAENTAVEDPAQGTDTANSSGTSEADEIDNLLNAVLEEENGTQSSGRGLSRLEEASLTQKIHNNWVKTPLIDKDNLQDLVVTVRFNTDRFGNLAGDIRMIYPQNPSPDHWIAFQTAQRAILDSMPLEMPADIDPNGVIWTINFDPASQNGRIN